MEFFKRKTVYVDRLHEYRKNKVGDFNLFDEVWVIETCEQALSRIPWYKWRKKEKWKPIAWIIIGEDWALYCSDDTEFQEFEKMELSWWTSDKTVAYKAPWYTVITKTWEIIKWYEVKRNRWEFEEAFSYMEESEHKQKLLDEAQKLYEKRLAEMESHLVKWKEIQKKALSKFNP